MPLSALSTFSNYKSNQFWLLTLLGGIYTLAVGYAVSRLGAPGAIAGIILPVVISLVILILTEPRWGLFFYVHMSYTIGFTRFALVEIPIGLLIDGLLSLTLLSLFVNGKRMEWNRLRSGAFALVAIWFAYTVIELINP